MKKQIPELATKIDVSSLFSEEIHNKIQKIISKQPNQHSFQENPKSADTKEKGRQNG